MNVIVMFVMAVNAAAAPAPANGDARGKENFAKKCVACHSKDGKGSASMAKMFKVEPKFLDLTSDEVRKKADADLAKTIGNGRNKMPAFKGKLKDGEIADVIAYIRALPAKQDGAK